MSCRWVLISLVVPLVVVVSARFRPQSRVTVHHAAAFDISPPLASLRGGALETEAPECERGCGTSPSEEAEQDPQTPAASAVPAAGAAVEQISQGARPPAATIASFDGLGFGFTGPQGTSTGRNPSDNSLAVGPDHVVQIVNSRMAVFSKSGKVLYGAVPTNTLFKGFGGACEARNNGDAVVRYDQLAGRWLYVMPLFQRIPNRTEEPYSVCYALSTGPDPLGPYYRYEFRRKLFPDYPRPAVWTDGYYVPTSTGDTVIQKHACVVDREKMLQGGDAAEQCVIIDGANFLNNADIDGHGLPPAGAPNIIMAAGGTQLKGKLDDDGIFVWQFHVDWKDPSKTAVSGPVKIAVAPYHYLCGGQLTRCVPQPDSTQRLDAQGDKIMQRLVYRNLGSHESIVALHSVDTAAGGGGVRWYEFRLDDKRSPYLYQQGTYAPDRFFRWMGSIGMDRQGDIAMGYSFGGTPNFAGQRFAARLAADPPGALNFRETVLAEGEGSQMYGNRWEDYATLAMDPTDDCTFWYAGDYYKKGAAAYSTRIGAFRLPGCLAAHASGSVYFDRNHNGRRDPGEPGVAGQEIDYAGAQTGKLATDANGNFIVRLPADPAYSDPTYTFSAAGQPKRTFRLTDRDDVSGIDFGTTCTAPVTGGAGFSFWSKGGGKAALAAHDPQWRQVLAETVGVKLADYDQFRAWLKKADGASANLAMAALNVAFGKLDANATVEDTVAGGWASLREVVQRAGARRDGSYAGLLQSLNANTATVTPSKPEGCPGR